MSEDEIFFTKTMAKIYTEQGNVRKAAEIYRYLLEREPDRQDLLDALAEIKGNKTKNTSQDFFSLIQKWIHLMIKSKQLKRGSSLKELI